MSIGSYQSNTWALLPMPIKTFHALETRKTLVSLLSAIIIYSSQIKVPMRPVTPSRR